MVQFHLKPYSNERFFNREAEVNLVKGFLQQFRGSGELAKHRKAILFRGERGFGKTWLSLHFHRTVLKELNVKSIYLALSPLPSEYQEDLQGNEWVIPDSFQPEKVCQELMQWVCERLQIKYPNEPTAVELQRALIQGIEEKYKYSNSLVIILDSVFEADWNLLETVEKHFLSPLAELPNTLFIMTGRGRSYPWTSSTLRMGMEEEQLEHFSPEILEQFKMVFAPDSTLDNTEFSNLSGGSPLVSYLLLQADDPVRSLDAVADYLLEIAPPEESRHRLREAFEALCVLDEFREGEMEVMLNAYYKEKGLTIPDIPVRDLRDKLIKTYLFRWEGDGFKIDASLQNVLCNYLKISQHDLWKRLVCEAYQIYAGFARKYPQYEKEYYKLAVPYKNILEDIDAWGECEKIVLNLSGA